MRYEETSHINKARYILFYIPIRQGGEIYDMLSFVFPIYWLSVDFEVRIISDTSLYSFNLL